MECVFGKVKVQQMVTKSTANGHEKYSKWSRKLQQMVTKNTAGKSA
jgi:hypothetical protein